MTALLARPAGGSSTTPSTWAIGAPRLLAGLQSHDVLDAHAHLAVHGPMPVTDLPHLLAHLDAVRLSGRGGAGFPLAAKLRSVHGTRTRVVVNGAESEPASGKDRVLLRRSPHLVLDGALAVAASIGTRSVTVAVHDRGTAEAVRTAAAQRPDAALVRVAAIDGGFVAGEARAVMRAIDGGPAIPTGRRTPPSAHGDLLSNPETFAQLAVLLRLGPRRFAATGTRAEPGTTLLSVGGAVGRPGVVEIPFGTPLGIVLGAAGVGAAGAGAPTAAITGGYHGTWMQPAPQILVSRDGLAAAGGTLGAGVLLVLDGATCALGELARAAAWLAAESAGQCGPCRFGLPALAADVEALYRGQRSALPNAFGHARSVDGRGACSHPDGAARFVTSGLHLLQDETDAHMRAGGCGRPVLGQLPIGGAR